MAFSSGSTLQQTDEVAAVAPGSSGGSGGGGGASTWDALSDKPTVLTPPGFNAGNFPSAEKLASADIATALSHSPGLAGGIRTEADSIRSGGTETDTALATEAAIRSAIDSSISSSEVFVDLWDDGTTDIDPLKQISTTGDTNGIFGVGNESGELAVDVGKKWPDADKLDGVEGSNYARTDINEFLAPNVTYDFKRDIDDASDLPTIRFPSNSGIAEASGNGSLAQDRLILFGRNGHRFYDFNGTTWVHAATISRVENAFGIKGANTGFGGETAPSYAVDAAGDIRAQGTIRNDLVDLETVSGSNRNDGNIISWQKSAGEYQHFDLEEFITENVDTGNFNDISVGGVAAVRQPTKPTASDYPGFGAIPKNAFWVNTSTSPATLKRYDGSQFVTQDGGLVDGGLLVAKTVDARRIKANTITSDEIKGDTILGGNISSSTTITVGASTPNILIDGSSDPAKIESTNFSSLTEGFRLQSDGKAEFGDIRARGAIKSAVFEVNEQTLRGGTDIVTPSSTLAQAASVGDTTIEVRDAIFDAGEDIRFKEGGTVEIRTISSASGTTLTLGSGLNNAWSSGAAVARWNAARIVNSSDTQFAPFTDWVSADNEVVVRAGNLEGIAGLSGYGISIGQGALSWDSQTEALQLRDGSVGRFDFSGQSVSDGSLFLDSQKTALWFDSDVHPDLSVAFGDFDRATLPTQTDVTGTFVASPDFTSGWDTNWDFRPQAKILSSTSNGGNITIDGARFNKDDVDTSGTVRVDTTGDGSLDTTVNISSVSETSAINGDIVIGLSSDLGADYSGNKCDFSFNERVEGRDAGSVTRGSDIYLISDTGNDLSSAARAEVSSDSNNPDVTGISAPIGQTLDFSGRSGNDFTFRFFSEAANPNGATVAEVYLLDGGDGSEIASRRLDDVAGNGNATFGVTIPASEQIRVEIRPDEVRRDIGSGDGEVKDIQEIRILDTLFNSVITADGMLWRDSFNNETMDFDSSTGDMTLGGTLNADEAITSDTEIGSGGTLLRSGGYLEVPINKNPPTPPSGKARIYHQTNLNGDNVIKLVRSDGTIATYEPI